MEKTGKQKNTDTGTSQDRAWSLRKSLVAVTVTVTMRSMRSMCGGFISRMELEHCNVCL